MGSLCSSLAFATSLQGLIFFSTLLFKPLDGRQASIPYSVILHIVVQVTFVGEGFTRKAPKYERFIRPTGLRFKKAHVTHPELKATFHLDILGVKKNPSSPLYTQVIGVRLSECVNVQTE